MQFASGLGVLVGAGAILAIAATGSTKNMATEYRVVDGNVRGELQNAMNRLGGENWEFVATSNVREGTAYAVFKRPRQ